MRCTVTRSPCPGRSPALLSHPLRRRDPSRIPPPRRHGAANSRLQPIAGVQGPGAALICFCLSLTFRSSLLYRKRSGINCATRPGHERNQFLRFPWRDDRKRSATSQQGFSCGHPSTFQPCHVSSNLPLGGQAPHPGFSTPRCSRSRECCVLRQLLQACPALFKQLVSFMAVNALGWQPSEPETTGRDLPRACCWEAFTAMQQWARLWPHFSAPPALVTWPRTSEINGEGQPRKLRGSG